MNLKNTKENLDNISGYKPTLRNFSSAFLYQYLLVPNEVKNPEYVYISEEYYNKQKSLELDSFITQWNMTWEMGHVRNLYHEENIPESLQWLKRYRDENIYLIPELRHSRYYAYSSIYHLLPKRILKFYGLPFLNPGIWPHVQRDWSIEKIIPIDFDLRLSKAFAFYIWPLLNGRTKMDYFSDNEPLRILAHNLDFWLPYINIIIEDRLKQFPRVNVEDKSQATAIEEARKNVPSDISIFRPLMGGPIWEGNEESWNILKEVIELADSNGRLRKLIEEIKLNRVQEDFSNKWSYEREDFERKLYKKRSKYKVKFVELSDTIPVIGRFSEIEDQMFWQNFMTILDPKEKQVIVLLRNGLTNLSEIGSKLGYANHSPISKALRKIQKKLQQYD